MIRTLLPLSFRAEGNDRITLALPVIAFAAVTALMLTLIGGAQTFWIVQDGDTINYQAATVVALSLLVVPLGALGGAAARLSARRRDERLSTLRLLGVTASDVRRLTVLESAILALVGALGGVVGSFVLLPAISLIHFRGAAIGLPNVVPPAWVYVLVVLGITALAAVSALLGTRAVVISPLGVRTRQNAPKLSWMRVLIVIAVVLVALGALGSLSSMETSAILITIAAMFGGTLAVLNLIGPWYLGRRARKQAKKADTPIALLAARRVTEDPKAAWRQVSGVSMASFMAVFVGSGVALISSIGMSDVHDSREIFLTDVRTGLLITVLGSFLIVACAVGVSQAADIIDRREFSRSLVMLGADIELIDAARRRSVMSPVLTTSIASAATAAIILLPVVGIGLIVSPLTMIVIALVLAGGCGVVWAGLRVTRGLQERTAALAA